MNAFSSPQRHSLEPLRALVETHLRAQEWQECIAACRALLKRDRRHHFAQETLATALMQMGNVDDATSAVARLVELSPRDPFHRLRYATLLQMRGKHGDSTREFERVALMYPDEPFAGDAREAVENLDRLQTSQIFLLAAEQLPFRWLLERDPASALEENGFYLSENGLDSLKQMIPGFDEDAPPEPNTAPKMH
ncbi:hypothetical protein IAD21_02207 [Abditibacteriota bacterium]|nr:hypothetical protein IAD21_02207 [Abditibacteriota bacterium]